MKLRSIFFAIVPLFVLLQYHLWLGSGGIVSAHHLYQAVQEQEKMNQQLIIRNDTLSAQADSLKNDHDLLEEHVRHDLGMIKQGEKFYQIVD